MESNVNSDVLCPDCLSSEDSDGDLFESLLGSNNTKFTRASLMNELEIRQALNEVSTSMNALDLITCDSNSRNLLENDSQTRLSDNILTTGINGSLTSKTPGTTDIKIQRNQECQILENSPHFSSVQKSSSLALKETDGGKADVTDGKLKSFLDCKTENEDRISLASKFPLVSSLHSTPIPVIMESSNEHRNLLKTPVNRFSKSLKETPNSKNLKKVAGNNNNIRTPTPSCQSRARFESQVAKKRQAILMDRRISLQLRNLDSPYRVYANEKMQLLPLPPSIAEVLLRGKLPQLISSVGY